MAAAQNAVVRLLRRPAAFDEAVALFRGASLEACLGALHGNDAVPAHTLRARVLLRLGRLPQAIAALESAADAARTDGTTRERGEIATLLGAAQHRAGNAPAAIDAFSAARAYVWSTGDADLHAELERHVATMHWSDGDLDAAERHARRALGAHCALVQALALEVLGAIAGSRGHAHTHAAFAEEALDLVERLPWREVWVEAALLRTLSIHAHNLPLPGVADRVAAHASSLPWTAEVAHHRYETLRNLGWCAVVAGDHLRAFRLFRESADYAPSSAWRVFCFIDRSFLAREMGERLFAAAELADAEQAARDVAWEATSSGERCALLLLAEVVAPHDVTRADAILERYRSLKRRMSPLVAQRDGMLRALECHAAGVVAAARGQRERAALLLDETFAIWRSRGFVWRATRTALEMVDMAGDTRRLPYAREHVGRFPNAWFARSPALREEPEPPRALHASG